MNAVETAGILGSRVIAFETQSCVKYLASACQATSVKREPGLSELWRSHAFHKIESVRHGVRPGSNQTLRTGTYIATSPPEQPKNAQYLTELDAAILQSCWYLESDADHLPSDHPLNVESLPQYSSPAARIASVPK
jgi:hypothetical protein